MLDLDTFKVLSTVVETGSFAKAAQKLDRAQSAVSYKIKKLEQSLNCEIFDREHYRATLTDMGRILLNEGDKLLQQASYIESLALRQQAGWESKLDIVIDGILPMRPILKALRDMQIANATTQVQLQIEYLSGVQHRFEKNNADLMLAKEVMAKDNLKAIRLPKLTNTLVVSREHPLASQKSVTRQMLQQYVELTIRDTSQDEQHAAITGQPLFGGEKVFFLSDFQQKKQALLMGLGFGWMPSYLIFEELVADKLVAIDSVEPNPQTLEPKLVYRLDKPQGKALQWLIENLTQEFTQAFPN